MTKRILVVEDQPDSRRIIRDMLASTDYEIIEAENGEEALAAVGKQRPDLILMDMSLPVVDGWEATRRLKAEPLTRAIPVIGLTAHAMTGDRDKAIAAGCDDYDTKPVELPRLLQKIETLLARAGQLS